MIWQLFLVLNLSMKIPVQNIYYLLCYAWDKLDERDLIHVSAQDQITLLDLLAEVLIKATHRLFRQGLFHAYQSEKSSLTGIRGKLLFTESLQKNEFLQGRAICEQDVYSANQPVNQILKSTLKALLLLPSFPQQSRLRHLHLRMTGIDEIKLSEPLFSKVTVPRHPSTYRFVLNICELLHKNLLVNEEKGTYQFRDFWRDERQMAILFEAFVRNFYRHELPQWKVRRETIHWQLTASESDRSLLPLMQTDLTLEQKDQKIILDTKYYAETFQRYFETRKVHSPHLYQLFAYLKNYPASGKLRGILLYPTVTQSVSAFFSDETHQIQVQTLDLNQHWSGIHRDLLKLVDPNLN